MKNTYTIATTSEGMLVACVPDGSDVDAAIEKMADECGVGDFGDVALTEGVTLTDEEIDGDVTVYSGSQMGWLSDSAGVNYMHAVIRK